MIQKPKCLIHTSNPVTPSRGIPATRPRLESGSVPRWRLACWPYHQAVSTVGMRSHPLNVRPLGNLLTAPIPPTPRSASLGILCSLSDALIARVLESLLLYTHPLLAAKSLCRFAAVSTATRAFAFDEDLWRRLALSHFSPSVLSSFAHSWRYTFLVQVGAVPSLRYTQGAPFFSDVLFLKWRCMNAEIDQEWLLHDDLERIHVNRVNLHQFRERFESRGVPVVIKGVVDQWPAYADWSPEGLQSQCGDALLNAGGYQFSMSHYLRYCTSIEGYDDQPLYVFDQRFGEKVPSLLDQYQTPGYFSQDLLKVFGEQRPDFRWLIVGPARSGSSFHKDPNATSAWNAVVRGEKKWVMFPPESPPPGVVPSGDEGDVVAPVSVTEWFLNFYDRGVVERSGGKECVVKEGEIIFVPMGWWHCVLNTKKSIAVTQNYVSDVNVAHVAKWMRDRPYQVSGCRSKEQAAFIARSFVEFVVKEFPHLEGIPTKIKTTPYAGRTNSVNIHNVQKKRKASLWESLQTVQTRSKVGEKSRRTAVACQKDEPATQETKAVGFSFQF